ncbi:peptidase inhibitor family I36 protein [Spirillospora sp. NPDC127200]
MQLKQIMRCVVTTAACAGSAIALLAGPANASPESSVQDQINDQLRDYPGGVQTAHNKVSYDGGRVVLTIPVSGTARAAADPCATNAYCFYDGPDFTGRKLTFRDCGGNQSLTDYGFGNKTSSWVNKTRHTVEVYDKDVSPFITLWREAPGAASANVGTAAYNKADFFYTSCGT